MQTGTEADAASLAMPSYLILQEIAVVPQQDSDQLAFDLNQTVYTKAPEQVGHRSLFCSSIYVNVRRCSMQRHNKISSPCSMVSHSQFSRQVRDPVFMIRML